MRFILGLLAVLLLNDGLGAWDASERAMSPDAALHGRLHGIGACIASGCFALACAVVHAGLEVRRAVDRVRDEVELLSGRPAEAPPERPPAPARRGLDPVTLVLGVLVTIVLALALVRNLS